MCTRPLAFEQYSFIWPLSIQYYNTNTTLCVWCSHLPLSIIMVSRFAQAQHVAFCCSVYSSHMVKAACLTILVDSQGNSGCQNMNKFLVAGRPTSFVFDFRHNSHRVCAFLCCWAGPALSESQHLPRQVDVSSHRCCFKIDSQCRSGTGIWPCV